MKHSILLLCCIISMISSSYAKTLRVGFNGGIVGVDFTTVQAAHDNANDGDTIQIYGITNNGGKGPSGEVVIAKKLYIVGFGFNLKNDSNLQATNLQYPSQINGIIFTPGSQHTIIEGVNLTGTEYPQTNNITFKRCTISSCGFQGSTLDSVLFLSCYINGQIKGDVFDHTNIIFSNCIFSKATLINFSSNTTGLILNCITTYNTTRNDLTTISNSKFLLQNCILELGVLYSGPTANTIYENNFFTNPVPSTALTGSNNRFSQLYSDIYTGTSGDYSSCWDINSSCFTEEYYTLKSGSPAINGGVNLSGSVTDCGIFGGEFVWVYKLGSVPAIPSIYKLTAPSVDANANPYNVTISVRSNN